MNLGKLLGAGKSFFGGRGTVSYREDKRVYLPKFNAEKNPFTPKKEPSAAAPEAKKISPPAARPATAPAQKKLPTAAPGPTRSLGWTSRLNPFRASAPVAPPMVQAVQAELSLDAVKVVHNDLADADIEIVPVKSHTLATPETPVLPPPRPAWEFLSERLIKAG
jgi:hypothetical protein